MQTVCFLAPLPLRRHTPSRKEDGSCDRRTHPACVAKPPPRTPQSGSIPKSNKRKQRKNIRLSASRPTEQLTAAQLSEKLSRAVGFDLVLEDITSLTEFLRSFAKPKSSNPTQEKADDDPDSELQSETSLTIPAQSQCYKPRSATAANIVTGYTAARGAVDRALHTFSIHAQLYVNAAAQVAGDTVCRILSVGHQAFPGLKLDRAKDAVTGVLKDGWTPLSVFQWQLSAGPDEKLEQRRQARTQQISKFFRGGGVDDFLNATGSALGGVGKAAEKLAPIVFRGMSKAAPGYAERAHSSNLSRLTLGDKVVIRKQQKQKTPRDKRKYMQSLQKRVLNASISADKDITAKSLSTLRVQRSELASPKQPEEANFAIPSITSGHHEVHPETESRDRAEHDVPPSTATASADSNTSEFVQKGNKELLRSGAIVLAAGAVATAAASVSMPTAITCSTLMVASMALSSAKAAKAGELQVQARHRVRQSRSVQSLEGVLVKAATVSNVDAKVRRALLLPAAQMMQKRKDAVVQTTKPFPTSTRAAEGSSSGTVEASAYAVSASQPLIMSMPVVGFLLNWLDLMVYRVEGLLETVLRRSGLRYTRSKEAAGWELLRSFQRKSRPD